MDSNATTALDEEIFQQMLPYLKEHYGNPSSIHRYGGCARSAVESARRRVAQLLNCTARRVIFTSGGSESDNLAIKGVLGAAGRKDGHIVTTAIEHPAVLSLCKNLERKGYQVTYLPVEKTGQVSVSLFKASLRPDTLLATVMLANNETGVIQPVAELAEIARQRGIIFHTDAVQALGKIPLDVEKLNVDLLSVSSHKISGPKGVGALFVRKGIDLEPLIHGGGQERGVRSGTENVAGAVGFGAACESAQQRMNRGDSLRIATLRDRLQESLQRLCPDMKINGCSSHRIPNTLSAVIPGVRGESLVYALDRRGICLSSGSACKAGSPEPSHALLALGLTPEEAHCSVRFSLGHLNSDEDIDYVVETLAETLSGDSAIIRFLPCR